MRWPVVTGTVAVLVLGIATAFNTVRLSQMEQEARSANLDAEMQTLGDSVAQLRGAFEAAQRQPPSMSEAAFRAAQQATGERITRLEQAQAGAAKAEDLAALSARTDVLQSQVAARPATVSKPRVSDASDPKLLPPPPPPFTVLGTELRAGVPFLAIIPKDGASPAEVRLLREGDQERGWRLEAIERDTAQFTVGEQVRRLPLRSR
ncbi:hypothetical protein J7432_07580 [Xanthomonas axonopodis pv. begoniae]|nr:hypothetical protein [Xanthomonas axonopodis pv. begoniae]MBO9772931.1 hypothetical protein [Xanthomonas axonopodis pv. begoniae]PPT31993.1 hypothetical protein XabCFBP2524_20525 [Xanthomonas axonopodis pv. begoniae]